ncbi:MAG TPA: hypothetical protein VHA55_08245 [Pseudorhodoplanes sp.]|nr:hypothetical protein [Pseudorhodoplanes sp.]
MAEPSIPIEENMRFQRATWKAERAGWVILTLIVAAALLGVFSNGYLSFTQIGDENGFGVSYERFQRKTVTTHLRVNLPADDDNEAHLRIGKSALDDYEIDSIDPRPVRAAADQSDLVFDFDAGSARKLTAFIALRPRRATIARFDLSTPGQKPLTLQALVYP